MSSSALIFEGAASLGLRLAFFFSCRSYVHKILFADLREVITEESEPASPGPGRSDFSLLPLHASASSTSPLRKTRSPAPQSGSRQTIYSKLSSLIFCLTFSESCILFTLILFGNALNESARWTNWTASLTVLVAFILLVIPCGQCLLVTHRNTPSTGTSFSVPTLGLTLALFLGYIFLFNYVGQILSQTLGVQQGTHSIGILNSAVERICVPGVLLIAGLSGAGAVNTAWEAYEWRERYQGRPVTEASLATAERSFRKTCEDLQSRRDELNVTTATSKPGNFITNMFTTDANQSRRNNLEMEISGLQSLEIQMRRDLNNMRSRKRAIEMSGTLKGMVVQYVGVLFTLYCLLRVGLASLSLIPWLQRSSSSTSPERSDRFAPILSGLASWLGLELDIPKWSHTAGLMMIGCIILVNMKTVLASVSRVFRAASTGLSTSFMLLFLSQLMAIYLVTSLISLPSSGTSDDLLSSLPDFSIFSRVFDLIFFVSAVGWAALRFFERKIRVEDLGGAFG